MNKKTFILLQEGAEIYFIDDQIFGIVKSIHDENMVWHLKNRIENYEPQVPYNPDVGSLVAIHWDDDIWTLEDRYFDSTEYADDDSQEEVFIIVKDQKHKLQLLLKYGIADD